MLELAITQGVDFIAFTRNAKAISLPNGTTVLGPLASFPHVSGDYTIRKVEVTGPQPSALETGGVEAPVVEGDVVVIRRTVQAVAEEQEATLLAVARKEACDAIDRMAETVRGRYLTAGAGQAMVYQQKVAEARDHQAGGTGPWPHLTAEVGITAFDEAGVAAVILATEAAWLEISALIEGARLKAKRDIAAAALDDIAAIVAAVEWPDGQ